MAASPKSAPPPAGLEVGDHVYANGRQGALLLKVLAAGRDGFTGQDERGARHKIPHGDYLGHKTRQLQTWRVVDRGADGSLLEDASGRRRFLAGKLPPDGTAGGPPSEPSGEAAGAKRIDDPLLDKGRLFAKSLTPLPPLPDGMVLFLKAVPGGHLANRPGLVKRQITDRTGRRSSRWVRSVKDEPKERDKAASDKAKAEPLHRHGQQVRFRHGDVEGAGKIVASGQDGVTVQTPDGREHQVRHDALLPPKPGEDRTPPQDKPPPPAPAKESAAPIKPLFDAALTQGLPEKAAQPVKSKEELYAKITEAQNQIQDWLNKGKGVASQLGYEHVKAAPEDTDMDQPGGMLFIAPVKSEKRAAEKVEQDYGGDWSQLLDPVRASMAVDSYDELARVMGALTASGMTLARKPKDRFSKPLPVGYRDALLNVTLPNGLIGELQLHVKPMLKAKGEGHKYYEVERTLQGKKLSGLSDEEHATLQAAIDSQTAIYEAAWAAATGQGDQGSMTKALQPEAAGKYKYFEHDNAKYRRLEKPPFRAVDDVLHGRAWVAYRGDRLKPGLFGEEIPDPLGGVTSSSGADDDRQPARGPTVP